MRVGIIGLPQVGKSSIFRVLTHAPVVESHHKEAQVGIARVVDPRLDQLAKLIPPDKLTYTTVECVDMGPVGADTMRETAYLTSLKQTDALLQVVRMFADDTVPHIKGTLDPARDITDLELELILTDLSVVENRLARIEKDRKKGSTPELIREQELLERAKTVLEDNQPLRAAQWSDDERKRLRGYTFLSEKSMLIVFNVGEDQVSDEARILNDPQNQPLWKRPNTSGVVVSGKLEAELALMPSEEAIEFLGSYGLKEPGRDRIVRAAHDLLGLIVFFTVGEEEDRSWSIPRGATAPQAAGAIHSDLEKHFIRAEVIPWDTLIELGGFTEAKAKGLLRLEGKEYIVKDGDIMHIRHSG
ncbi:MAG: redox-regulated ATPase YchF [Acidobacteria bacterium]|nr:redox-regulated ATPase YchF [Acidobacteriota bacterium]